MATAAKNWSITVTSAPLRTTRTTISRPHSDKPKEASHEMFFGNSQTPPLRSAGRDADVAGLAPCPRRQIPRQREHPIRLTRMPSTRQGNSPTSVPKR